MIFNFVKNDCFLDASESMYPCTLKGFTQGEHSFPLSTSTYYGYVLNGQYEIRRQGKAGTYLYTTVSSGMYFSLTGSFAIFGSGEIIVIERLGYRGLCQFGGPIEDKGRLCYIDNSSTTMILPPPRVGDPVFNLLVFPPNVVQTPHIHPTVRLGVVAKGEGECILPNRESIPLKPGVTFYLTEESVHSFNSSAQGLTIIAFHPESETGPTDSSHPMLNRTYTKF